MKVVSVSGTLKIGGVVMKWTPVGLKTDKYEFFYPKNPFLPDANQKSESVKILQLHTAPPVDLLGKQHTCDPAMLNRSISPLLLYIHHLT